MSSNKNSNFWGKITAEREDFSLGERVCAKPQEIQKGDSFSHTQFKCDQYLLKKAESSDGPFPILDESSPSKTVSISLIFSKARKENDSKSCPH